MNCCYNCQRRHAGCHSQCADYAEYRMQLEADKAEKAKTRDIERMMRYYTRDSMKRKGLVV